jgi:hypothetical protein
MRLFSYSSNNMHSREIVFSFGTYQWSTLTTNEESQIRWASKALSWIYGWMTECQRGYYEHLHQRLWVWWCWIVYLSIYLHFSPRTWSEPEPDLDQTVWTWTASDRVQVQVKWTGPWGSGPGSAKSAWTWPGPDCGQ